MNDLVGTDGIYYISIPEGKVFPGERNRNPAGCQNCKAELNRGRGMRFAKGRFFKENEWNNGYLCPECVAGRFRRVERWHFNPVQGILFPAMVVTVWPLDGERLAEKLLEKGAPGLMEAVAEARAEFRKHAVIPQG